MNESIRVLLVEDDHLIALAMEMELKRSGYRVCSRVATGEDAIISAKKELPDVVLMDIRLAGKLDGVDAAIRIREFSDTSIIFLTGYQDPLTEERARSVDPMAYLIKPANLITLRELIDTVK